MKIESLIKRKGGSTVEMDAPQRTYRFAPESGNHADPHVAEVEEQSHVRALLRIREGYRVLSGEEFQEEAQQQLKQEEQLIGSVIHSASYEIKGGETIALGDLVAMAFQDSGMTAEQWNKTTDEERYGYIDATLLELQEGKQASEQTAHQEKPADEPKQPDPVKDEAPAEKPQDEPAVKGDAPADTPLNQLPRKDLTVMYQKRFGRQPSTRMTIDDIANALSEED